MKAETQIKTAKITAIILVLVPLVAIMVLLVGTLLSIFTPLQPPTVLDLFHSLTSFGIVFAAMLLSALIILYCFISALSENKFVKGLVFFLLYCGLLCSSHFMVEEPTNLGTFLNIVVFLLLLQGVIGLYKVQKIKAGEKLQHSEENEHQKTNPEAEQK